MRAEFVQTQWARLLLGGLAGSGVRRAIISPGARSTPLTAAALATPGLECQAVADERVAGFVALGMARVTGEPALLLCTSGTAGAHYLPAVMEAAHAHVPLVVLTADRPPELHHCGASQTVEQSRLYGSHVRHFADLGPPEPSPPTLRAVLRRAAQAAAASRWPLPGPVHLNAPVRKPLEPAEAADGEERRFEALVDDLLNTGPPRIFPPPVGAPAEGVREVAELCRAARRGLVLAGPAPARAAAAREAVWRLARVTGFPLAVEAASQLLLAGPVPNGVVALSHMDLLLGLPAVRQFLRPDVVIQIGATPTAAAWPAAMEGWPAARLVVVAPHGWNDPTGRAGVLIQAPAGDVLGAVAETLERRGVEGTEGGWRDRAAALSAAVAAAVAGVLDGPGDSLREVMAVRQAAAALPPESWLMVGNSLPVRDVDLACPAGWSRAGVLSQRGASGIDGLVSGAAGAALAARGPVVAVLGDVSFLHDIGGLAVARQVGSPLVLVVLDNGGGRVFDQLPVGCTAAFSGPGAGFWRTPPELDLAAAAAAFGVPHRRVSGGEGLGGPVNAALSRGGCTVLEVPLDPQGVRQERQQLAAAVAAAADAVLGGASS